MVARRYGRVEPDLHVIRSWWIATTTLMQLASARQPPTHPLGGSLVTRTPRLRYGVSHELSALLSVRMKGCSVRPLRGERSVVPTMRCARPRRRCSDRGPVVPNTSAIGSGLTAGLAISGPLDPVHGLRSSSEGLKLRPVASPSAGLIVVVPVVVVVRMVFRGGSALTGRVGRHSTAGLAVVAAASLVVAQLDEGVGRSHPQLGSEGGVVGGPVGKEGPGAWSRPRLLTGL